MLVKKLICRLSHFLREDMTAWPTSKLQLSFWKFGPTELRLLLSIGNVALFLRGPFAHLAGRAFRLFDIGGLIGAVGMAIMLIAVTVRNTHRLYIEEPIR